MASISVFLMALLALGPPPRVQEDPGDNRSRTPRGELETIAARYGATTPGERYRALCRDYDEARGGYERALREAKSDEARRKIYAEDHVRPEQYTHLFLMIAQLYPEDPAAREALIWIGSHDPAGPEGHEAMKVLSRDHISSDGLGPACDAVASLPTAAAESFLRTVAEKSPHREVRARAGFVLALVLKRWSENAADLGDAGSPRARQMARYFGEPVAERIRKDPRSIAEEAERLFRRVQQTAGDVAFQGGRLGEAAEQALYEMRDLAVGKPAPEILGDDLDGRPMRLSEFLGRVVVVNFWATWCGPCMALVPHERELVMRLEGQPFVLVGVNGDEDRDTAKKAVRGEGMSWRSWWDGGRAGPIASRWNVRGRPAIYILDRRGIIRHKWNESPGAEPLKRAVADVLMSLPDDPKLGRERR